MYLILEIAYRREGPMSSPYFKKHKRDQLTRAIEREGTRRRKLTRTVEGNGTAVDKL